MRLYAETASLRARQVVTDLLVVAWATTWVLAGLTLKRLLDKLAGPGRTLRDAGSELAGSAGSIQDRVGRIPVVGDELRAPFGRVGDVGRTLVRAGETQQQVVHDLALWLGLVVAVLPVALVLLWWGPRRWRWVTEASAASRFRAGVSDLELFALRAVANRPLRELRRVSADPAADLAAGDYEALAALELRALGLRADPPRGRGRPEVAGP
ncbi:MAG TPA: hypothetical protein VG276_05850 [Actinomycetes bacterium]|jgi:hypothetical protein|nr:hypothetical protein [Actinomycetes bacterium]